MSINSRNDAIRNQIRVLCPQLLVLVRALGVITPVTVQQQHYEACGVHKAGRTAPATPRMQAKRDADDDVPEVVNVPSVPPESRDQQFPANFPGWAAPYETSGVRFEFVLLLVGDTKNKVSYGKGGVTNRDGKFIQRRAGAVAAGCRHMSRAEDDPVNMVSPKTSENLTVE